MISLLSEQQGIEDKGGTMRLGAYPCRLVPGTKAQAAYGVDEVRERHRHRYEFNNAYREPLEALRPDRQRHVAGRHRWSRSARSADHPFMVGTQFHPEFRSRPDRPHPLFRELIAPPANAPGRRDDRSRRSRRTTGRRLASRLGQSRLDVDSQVFGTHISAD